MKAVVSAVRRVVIIAMLVVVVVIGGVLGLWKMRPGLIRPHVSPKTAAYLDYVDAHATRAKGYVVGRFGNYFQKHEEEAHHEQTRIVATSPTVQDVIISDSFVCQIRSQRHIEVRALEPGYLSKISVKEGQVVKQGDVMFKVLPVLYAAKLNAEAAEAQFARLKFMQTQKLRSTNVVSDQEVKLYEAELAKADAKKALASAELSFTDIKAPFDGIVDRLLQREGSLVDDGDVLTTLADNSVMWVYFNVPEKYYLDYMANRNRREKEDKIDLVLANGDTFPQPGKIGAIEADFNNENGNIKFRADYPNPDLLLRHGQTGTIKIRRPLKQALLIPQRATFERLDKLYVWVVGEDHVVHQRLITYSHELEDIFVVDSGLKAGEKIVLEGIREVEEGGKSEYEFMKPEVALKSQKHHAE